jgi:iron complex transport system substrate-binding protein
MLKHCAWALLLLLTMDAAAHAATFTDAGGRVVNIPDKIGKVIAAGPPAAVLIYALAPEKLAGWVRGPTEQEKSFLIPSTRTLPVYGTLAGKDGAVDIEAVRKAKPDLIIDVGTVNADYIALANKVQKQTGIPYILVDGRLAKTGNALRQLGLMLDDADRGNALGTYTDDRLNQLGAEIRKIPAGARPRIYYGRGADGLQTGLDGSINMEIFGVLGATNVAAAAGKGGLFTVTRQQVLAWNPDIILASDPAFFAALKSDPSWASIKAVRNGNIFKAPDIPFGWFDSPPGVNRLIGLVWLQAVFYPKIFDIDMRAEVRNFFNLFYQVDVMGGDFDTLFAGADTHH